MDINNIKTFKGDGWFSDMPVKQIPKEKFLSGSYTLFPVYPAFLSVIEYK